MGNKTIDNNEELPRIDEDLRKVFAKRLKRLRTEKDLTLHEFAKILSERYSVGVTYGSLGNYERASRIPDLYLLSCLAEFFDVTTDFLLGKSDLRDTNVIQTTMFDENSIKKEIKIGITKGSELENMSIKEVKELVSKLKDLGIDFDKI